MGATTVPDLDHASARPCPALRGLVDLYLGYRIDGQPPGVHRGLPSRHVTVVVSLDGPVVMTGAGPGGAPLALEALAGGLHARAVEMVRAPRERGVQLALTPSGLAALSGMPAGELAGTVLPLDAVLGPRTAELTERLHAARGWPAAFTVLDDVLTGLLRDRPPRRATELSPEVDHAWRTLRRTAGARPVQALAAEVGWSRRHLAERFRREIGLTPKTAGKVLRFERSRGLVVAGHRLAEVAATCGYADQAHLSRDWNELVGLPPSAWLVAEGVLLRREYADGEFPFVQAADRADSAPSTV